MRTTNAKSINLHTIRKIVEYSLKNFIAKAIFIYITLETLLSKRRLVLQTARKGTGSKSVKVSVKNQRNIWNLLILLEKWLPYKPRGFWMVSKSFWFCLTLPVLGKLKKLIFKIQIITQILNINYLTTTSAKSINLHTFKNLVKYSFKKLVAKAMFILTALEILPPVATLVMWRAQRGT